MSIITSGDKALKDIERLKKTIFKRVDERFIDDYKNNPMNPWNECYKFNDPSSNAMAEYWKTFDASIRMGLMQANRYAMIKQQMIEAGELPYLTRGEKISRTYFITVRPDPKKIMFSNFYHKVIEFLNRKCFNNFILVFEQKGIDDDTLGQGFHIHVLAKMTQESPGKVVEDTFSTFKDSTAQHCIQVDRVKTVDDYERVLGYIRDHKAKDGHKKLTAETDVAWRKSLGLQALYTDVPNALALPPSIKSMVGGQETFTNSVGQKYSVEFN